MSVPSAATGTHDPVVDRLATVGRSPSLVIAEGALGAVLGIVVLAWPRPTATVLAVLFGILLLITGILQLVAAFSDATRAGGRALSGVLGTLSLLVGLLCLRDPLQTLVALGLLIGLVWTVGGVVRVVQGIVGERGVTRGWRIASGALSFLAGAVVLEYPGAGLVVLTAVLGVVLIVEGALLIAAGFAMRRRSPEAPVAGEATQIADSGPETPGHAVPRPAGPVPAVRRPPVPL